jgi:Leucine-rich repeat (LRR) protein
MKSLVVLNASNNSFTGQIPTTFCVTTPSFAMLELSYNQFSGRIPPELGNCSKLRSFFAGHNKLSGTLPDEFFNINSLEHLSLHDNQFEGSFSSIGNLTNLVTLDLGGNGLSGDIPNSIGDLKRLEVLHLSDNSISGELPSTLSNCTNLITIDVKKNNFSGELAKVNFSTLSKLKTLDIVWNNFTGTVPESIYSCSDLVTLRLSNNQFHGQLSERIGNLKSLSFLSLFNISLTNIKSTLQILTSCRNLTILLIGKNFMHEAMPEDDIARGFENLRVLSLSDCSLSGKISRWLSKLTNLEVLLLHDNQLTGPIPDWMSNLGFLFYIDISNNHLIGEIPRALIGMPMLRTDTDAPNILEVTVYMSESLQYRMLSAFPKVLNLGNNNLTGVIPEDIGQLTALISLNLSANKLTGAIPQSICNLTSLETLDLSGNRLTGAFPTSLNDLHFLSQFNVSNNDLEGTVPFTGQLSTFPSSSFEGNPKLCGPMLAHHCGSAETDFSIKQTSNNVEKVIFAVAFGAFFVVGVLYDQMVLSRYFG